jgi:hypothetical protein
MCRKHHGAMFATFAAAPLRGFRWVAGEDRIGRYQSSENGTRSFCRDCGSVTPMLVPAMDMVIVPAGNLDEDPGIRPQQHIFTASRAPWHAISDGLPQHEGYPPEFGGGKGIERPAPEAKEGVTAGSCLCGDVAWETEGEPERVMNCHCSRCRRGRGTAHATNAFYPVAKFRWIREGQRSSYPLPGAKFFTQDFCSRCGGLVARVIGDTGRVLVPCGALDNDPRKAPAGHIFVANKAPWFTIGDALPQWDGYPPSA